MLDKECLQQRGAVPGALNNQVNNIILAVCAPWRMQPLMECHC